MRVEEIIYAIRIPHRQQFTPEELRVEDKASKKAGGRPQKRYKVHNTMQQLMDDS